MSRHAIAAASLALLSLGATAAAHAQTSATVVIHAGTPRYQHPVPVQYHAPPPPRYEAQPSPRRGMAWVPGHWQQRGHRHVWMEGHWVKARPTHHSRPHAQPGRWDRDGDGVPNRHDRRPDNPYRW